MNSNHSRVFKDSFGSVFAISERK